MLRTFIAAGLIAVLFGCAPKEAAPAPEVAAKPSSSSAAPPTVGAEGGPTPISPALGGSSPVVGGESLGGGGGSAVGQLAKDKARSIASDAGSRSFDPDSQGN